MTEREILQQFRNTPQGQGLLKAIRFAEGTNGPQGYQTKFGGGTFSDMSRHPGQVVNSGGYSSAAAGAYQFLPGTWDSQAKRLGLQNFGPESQDIAALALARNRLLPIGGLAAVSKGGLTSQVSAQLAPEWASFPMENGKSAYGQPVKPLSQLQQVYGNIANVAPKPQPVVDPQPIQNPAPSPYTFANAAKELVMKQLFLQPPGGIGLGASNGLGLLNPLAFYP